MTQLSQEDQELTAKALWMSAFDATLQACKEMDLSSDASLVGMVTTMTIVIRQLFEKKEEE